MENEQEKRAGGGWRLAFLGKLSGERLPRALVFCILGFLFSRVHIIFGARPMAIALISVLSGEVFFALVGALLGSFFTDGGFIAAISLLITLFVRVIIGTADKDGRLFSEPLLLRMSAGLLGGFVRAVYEWLITGVSISSALYGASMLLLPPLFVFIFSGLDEHPLDAVLLGREPLPRLTRGGGGENISTVFFYVSALLFLHICCRSLLDVSLFGIDFAFVLAALCTLLVAMRHGALYAGAVGFISTLGISGVHSVSFALLGLLSGLLFPVGAPYALVGGALAFCFWSGYSEGLSGVLSTLPELAIAIALTTPLIKRVARREDTPEAEKPRRPADTLSAVGTMALSYRGKYSENTERLIASIRAISKISSSDGGECGRPSEAEYLAAITSAVRGFCAECEHREACERREVCPALHRAPELSKIIASGGRPAASDINTENEFCERCADIAKHINERVSALEYERARIRRISGFGEELSLISKMMCEARERDREDTALNSEKSRLAEEALTNAGISDFSVRVFGERRPRAFLAVLDGDGKTISSDVVKAALSEALGGELCDIEYYRDGEVAMLECTVKEKYSVSFSYKIRSAGGGVSGDSVSGIRTADGVFYGILADGMGRGDLAHRASDYLISLVQNLLSFGIGQDTLVKLLSCLMSRRGEANSTLDLFRFDLYTGEASFIKCGASPSYIKRDGTLYRIGSEGTPIGVGAESLGERVRVEVKPTDIVIMTSDGVADTKASSLKFIEKMSGEPCESLSDFAEELISLDGGGDDDRSALVVKILEGSKTPAFT